MLNNIGHIARRQGRLNEAIMFYQKAIRMEPKFVDAIASTALCYAVLGNIDKATEFFNKALAIDPFNETIRQCLSKMIQASKESYSVDQQTVNILYLMLSRFFVFSSRPHTTLKHTSVHKKFFRTVQ